MKFCCNELSLFVCFTRIAINVPRIVINCFGRYCIMVGWFQQPCLAYVDRCDSGHLWLRLSCSFSLMRSNRRIKADIIGPNAQSERFPAMSAGPAHPTRLRFGVPKLSERSCHVMPAWICAVAGICGCGIQESALLNMKTRHCISGCGRDVL